MRPQLYEILWEIVTDVGNFCHREFKAFYSDAEAKRYGKRRAHELNDGLPVEKRAQDGYYYKYLAALKVDEVDNHKLCLAGC